MKTEKRNTKKKNQYQEKYRHPTSTSNVSTNISLRKKCPYLELFRSAFSRIRTEYGEILRIQSECGEMRTRITPNLDTF